MSSFIKMIIILVVLLIIIFICITVSPLKEGWRRWRPWWNHRWFPHWTTYPSSVFITNDYAKTCSNHYQNCLERKGEIGKDQCVDALATCMKNLLP